MTIQQFNLDFYIQPKPRGIQGKHGNIYHSSKPYKLFKERFKTALEKQVRIPESPLAEPFFTGFFYGFKDAGQNPDMDNLEGAILDALQFCNYIVNDNRRFWIGSYKLNLPMNDHNSVFIIGTRLDRTNIIKKVDQIYSFHYSNSLR